MKKLACLVMVVVFITVAAPSLIAQTVSTVPATTNSVAIKSCYYLDGYEVLKANIDSLYYWDVYKVLKRNYVKPDSTPNDSAKAIWQRISQGVKANPASQESLIYAGLEKVAQLFDRYTRFFPPEETEGFRREMREEISFYGVGAIMGYSKKDTLTPRFIELLDGPAKNAGINTGDYLLKVNGRDCRKFALDKIISLIKGPGGTIVNLTIRRNGSSKIVTLKVKRAKIVFKTVKWSIVKSGTRNFGYIKLTTFNELAFSQMCEAADSLIANKAEGVILDLRNNGGGLMTESFKISGLFLGDGVVVCYQGSPNDMIRYTLNYTNKTLMGLPVVVLVNQNTASASEILSGILRDIISAKLIGETTYGKGCGQSVIDLRDGSAVKVTSFLWYTPKKINVSGIGLKPDIEVKTDLDEYLIKGDMVKNAAIEYLTNPETNK